MVAAYLGVKPRNRMTAEDILTTAPKGCLTIEELRRVVAANPLSA